MKQIAILLDDELYLVNRLAPLMLLEYLNLLELLTKSEEFSTLSHKICLRILQIHGLPKQPEYLARDLAINQLRSLNTMDPVDTKGDEKLCTTQEWVYSLIAALIPDGGIKAAIEVGKTFPFDIVEEVINERIRQLQADDPPISHPIYQELFKELNDAIQNSNGMLPNA